MEDTQLTLFGKTFPERSAAITEKIFGESSKKSQKPKFQYLKVENGQKAEWSNYQTVQSLGELLMPSISAFPSVAVESTLSQILEVNAPPKYYLSPTACQGILRRADKRGKELPKLLELALKAQAEGKFLVTTGTGIQAIGYRQSSYGDFTEGIGTLRASAGQHGVSSQDIVCEPKRVGAKTYAKGTRPHSADEAQKRNESDTANTLNTFDIGETRCSELVTELIQCFGVCSQNSNSMKSSNPHSGIYEANTARTLDCNGGNPACNQGGIVVAAGFQPNNSSTAAGLSEHKESAPTLSVTKQAGVICAIEQAVSFENSSFGGYKQGVGTLKASGGDNGGGSESLVCEPRSCNSSGSDVAGTLDASYFKGCGVRGGKEREFVSVPIKAENNLYVWIVRRLTPTECERLQGFEDDWTKYDTSGNELKDTPRYKALGNSIAIPCAVRVFQGIAEAGC